MIGKIFLSEFLILVKHAETPYYILKCFYGLKAINQNSEGN